MARTQLNKRVLLRQRSLCFLHPNEIIFVYYLNGIFLACLSMCTQYHLVVWFEILGRMSTWRGTQHSIGRFNALSRMSPLPMSSHSESHSQLSRGFLGRTASVGRQNWLSAHSWKSEVETALRCLQTMQRIQRPRRRQIDQPAMRSPRFPSILAVWRGMLAALRNSAIWNVHRKAATNSGVAVGERGSEGHHPSWRWILLMCFLRDQRE